MTANPVRELTALLEAMGDAGTRMSEIAGAEGAAGNISVYVSAHLDVGALFPREERVALGLAVPELAGGLLLVTGSGRRLREIARDPTAHLGCLKVHAGGRDATLCSGPARLFARLTSELESHLAVHADRVRLTGTPHHALVHAQPVHITYLTHVPRYRDETYLNRRLLRWQAETILNLPEGLGFVPFFVPGSSELVSATAASMRDHRIVVWGQHGLLARSDACIKVASDCIEYAEAAARYEYMNLASGEPASGLSPEDIRRVCAANGVRQSVF